MIIDYKKDLLNNIDQYYYFYIYNNQNKTKYF